MDFTFTIGGATLGAAALYVGKLARDRVKKWDKHVTDDEKTHALFAQSLKGQDKALEAVNTKLDTLILHLVK